MLVHAKASSPGREWFIKNLKGAGEEAKRTVRQFRATTAAFVDRCTAIGLKVEIVQAALKGPADASASIHCAHFSVRKEISRAQTYSVMMIATASTLAGMPFLSYNAQ